MNGTRWATSRCGWGWLTVGVMIGLSTQVKAADVQPSGPAWGGQLQGAAYQSSLEAGRNASVPTATMPAPASTLRDEIAKGRNPLRSLSLGTAHPLRMPAAPVQVAQLAPEIAAPRPRPQVVECPAELTQKSMEELSTSIATPAGDLPTDCRQQLDTQIERVRFLDRFEYSWEPSLLMHKPLYFEEAPLERYGHSRRPRLQPVVSGAHFYANVVTLPWKMLHDRPGMCLYELGYERPGSCVPHIKRRHLAIP